MGTDYETLPGIIDISAIAPNATLGDVSRACEIAVAYHCAGTCVTPAYLAYSMKNTIGAGNAWISNTTVVGFPEGSELTSVKVYAAKQAELTGAKRICLSINTGAFLIGNYKYVKQDIDAVCDTVKIPVDVILETAIFDELQLAKAAEVVSRTKAGGILTCSGFFGRSTPPQAIETLTGALREGLVLRAAGAIQSLGEIESLMNAGAQAFSLHFEQALSILQALDDKLGRPHAL